MLIPREVHLEAWDATGRRSVAPNIQSREPDGLKNASHALLPEDHPKEYFIAAVSNGDDDAVVIYCVDLLQRHGSLYREAVRLLDDQEFSLPVA